MAFDSKAFSREVGLLLQLARKQRGLTQEDLAIRIGVPRATYANLESGRQRAPLDIVWRAGLVLGVSLLSLVPEATPPTAARPSTVDQAGQLSTTHSLVALLADRNRVTRGLTKK
ncbi:MAG: helix-turn-helix transcriptional regulator [Vicinamibacterales bacterium]